MVDKKGALEVEVIRARGLVGKPGSKALPGENNQTPPQGAGVASELSQMNVLFSLPTTCRTF